MVWVTGNGLEKACISRPGQPLHCIDATGVCLFISCLLINLFTYLLIYLFILFTWQIQFYKACGDDNICEPELTVDWLNVSGVVVGSLSARAQVIANLRVDNTGETAYAVTLNVSFPRPSLQFAAATPERSVCVIHFLPRDAMRSADCVAARSLPVRLSVYLSVRPSHAGIVSKALNV